MRKYHFRDNNQKTTKAMLAKIVSGYTSAKYAAKRNFSGLITVPIEVMSIKKTATIFEAIMTQFTILFPSII
jgi:hypothetical protein